MTTVCDTEDVWLYRSTSGEISVWPEKCFGELLYIPSELSHIDIHDFIVYLQDMSSNADINVFPTTENSFMAHKDELLSYIVEELERIE